MSNQQKKIPSKAIAKTALVKPTKNIPVKHIPAVHVLTTFDDLMDNFRRNFIESIAFPFD
jgi:hypothetical protein